MINISKTIRVRSCVEIHVLPVLVWVSSGYSRVPDPHFFFFLVNIAHP